MHAHAESNVESIRRHLAEHNITWERVQKQLASAREAHRQGVDLSTHLGPFITVSRQHGTGGGELARILGEALDWSVINRQVVDLIADHLHVDPAMVDLLDEREANWVRDVLGDFLPGQVISRDTYVRHLAQVARMLAMHGRVVLLGRGTTFFLPRQQGLAIRLVADLKDRIARIQTRDGVDEAVARKTIEETDRIREHFHERYFGHDGTAPELYDLVLNTSSMPLKDIAELVIDACQLRGLTPDPELAAAAGAEG
jgi:hypothetical protein